jgi:hypothetical protein
MTHDEIADLLAQKEEIDRRNTETLATGAYERWIADALEALLKTIVVKSQAAASAKP